MDGSDVVSAMPRGILWRSFGTDVPMKGFDLLVDDGESIRVDRYLGFDTRGNVFWFFRDDKKDPPVKRWAYMNEYIYG